MIVMNEELQKIEETAERRWRRWLKFFRTFFAPALNFKCETYELDDPFIVVSNHVTNWDPYYVGLNFPRNHIHFVAGETLFQNGFVARFLEHTVSPIPRRKAASAVDTVMRCMRAIRGGGNVGIFAEGETTWNGVSNKIIPSTGKLVRSSGATLITYRIERGYFKHPRWSKTVRRLPVHGHIVGIYKPEQLKAMKPQQINELIERDIYEDAWARQREEQLVIDGDDRAVGIERALFLCPNCGKFDTVHGEGNRIRCSCGLDIEYTKLGFFDPPEPFETVYEWDQWQLAQLRGRTVEDGQALFSAPDATLTHFVDGKKKGTPVCTGTLTQYADALALGDTRFPLSEISDMALFKRKRLLFTVGTEYYEIRTDGECNLRKFFIVWQNAKRAE